MIPSWYDVLGVEPDAEPDVIEAAWREQIADLSPGDTRFRRLNKAAEVLLDADKRAAHDAELAADVDEDDEDLVPEEVAVPEALEGQPSRRATEPESSVEPVETTDPSRLAGARTSGTEDSDQPEDMPVEPVETTGPSRLAGAAREEGRQARLERRTSGTEDEPEAVRTGIGARFIVATVLLTLLAAALGTTAAIAQQRSNEREAIAEAAELAEATAREAVIPVVSYDWRAMDESEQAARAFMTDEYADDYSQLFSALRQGAEEVQPVVTTEVVESSVTTASADAVDVYMFVNRPTSTAAGTFIYRDQLTLQMKRVDDEWLVDGIVTQEPGT